MARGPCTASLEAEHMTALDHDAVLVIFSLHPSGRPHMGNVGLIVGPCDLAAMRTMEVA